MVFDAVGDVVGKVTSGVAGGAVSNVASKGAFAVTNKDEGSEGVIPGTVVESTAALASDLVPGSPADSDFRTNDLRLSLALAPRFGAVLELDFESMFGSNFESKGKPDFVPKFAPDLEADFEVVSAAAD